MPAVSASANAGTPAPSALQATSSPYPGFTNGGKCVFTEPFPVDFMPAYGCLNNPNTMNNMLNQRADINPRMDKLSK